MAKIQVVLPLDRETQGTVVYAVKNLKSLAVGQVYVNKTYMDELGENWPDHITVTIEPGDITGEQE